MARRAHALRSHCPFSWCVFFRVHTHSSPPRPGPLLSRKYTPVVLVCGCARAGARADGGRAGVERAREEPISLAKKNVARAHAALLWKMDPRIAPPVPGL